MHYICARHTNTTYVSKFQVNTVANVEVIRQNVFSHARVMVIGVSSDLKLHFVFKTFVFFYSKWPLRTGFTVVSKNGLINRLHNSSTTAHNRKPIKTVTM